MVTGVSVSEAQCDTSSCKNLQPDYDNTYEPNHETDYEPNYKPTYNVDINLELTVPNCPLAEVITERVKEAVSKYPKIKLIPHITTAAMSEDKLAKLVSDLKAERKENPLINLEIIPEFSLLLQVKAVLENLL